MADTAFKTIQDAIQLAAQTSSDTTKRALVGMLRSTIAAIESPADQLWNLMFTPHQLSAVRIGIEMRAFHTIETREGGQASAEEIAREIPCGGADPVLVARIMRVLAGMGVVKEVGREIFENEKMGKELVKDGLLEGGMKFMFDLMTQSIIKLPEALKNSDWKNPSGEPVAFQAAFGPGQNAFKVLGDRPSSLADFNNLMAQQRLHRAEWFDIFPVQDRLLDGFSRGLEDDPAPLLVDVGGAQGYELEQFRKRFPVVQGRLVLQDLPQTIDSITSLDTEIVRMKHDFFTPQPIKGARAYYFRSIFHDWDDEKCRLILRNLKPAMRRGFSKLLINDWVLADEKADLYPSLMDINMMAGFSSMERTESQFRTLLEGESFKIVKVWSLPMNEAIIEAELV